MISVWPIVCTITYQSLWSLLVELRLWNNCYLMLFLAVPWWFPFSGAFLGFLGREASHSVWICRSRHLPSLSLHSITERLSLSAVQMSGPHTSQWHVSPLPPSQTAGFSSCKTVSEGKILCCEEKQERTLGLYMSTEESQLPCIYGSGLWGMVIFSFLHSLGSQRSLPKSAG